MASNKADFYLVSTEGYGLEIPRECRIVSQVEIPGRNDLLLIQLDPPILYNNQDLTEVVVAARHKGESVLSIEHWPVYVHIARVRDHNMICPGPKVLLHSKSDLQNIAWGELYKTKEEATKAVQG